MQPQNNNPSVKPVRPVGVAGTAGTARPVRPVGSARPVRRPVATGGVSGANVAPMPAAEPEPTFDNGPSVVGKKERKTGWILAIILLLLIAAGGVGFGVWAYMDGNTQREQLNAQISSLTQQNSELQEKIEEITTKNNNTASGGSSGEVNNEDYVYVGETDYLYVEDWGIKIKISQNITHLSYFLDKRENEADEYLYVNGALGEHETIPSFVNNPEKFSLGCIDRVPHGADDVLLGRGDFVTSIDGYDYYYSASYQFVHSTDKADIDLENETIEALKGIFTNPENYSKV